MQLSEFIADQKQLLDDFAADYEQRFKRGKERTKFLPEDQWIELLTQYLEDHRGQPEDKEAGREAA